MAREIEAKCRLCRYIGEKLMLRGDKCTLKCQLDKKNAPPGPHSQRRRKVSDRGLQLREKQRVRHTYGLFERQFHKTFVEAERLPGITGENLMTLLERRLDNVAFRLGYGPSRYAARQLVRHGHVDVNGKRVDIPSYTVSEGDTITWHPSSTKTKIYGVVKEQIKDQATPGWLVLDRETLVGRVASLPTRSDVESTFNEKMIVEYYSR